MDVAEKAYYRDKLMEYKNDYIQEFSVCNSLLGRGKDLPLPPCESKQQLANEFNEYFIDKISKIRDILFSRIDDLNSRNYDHATYIMDPLAKTLLTTYRELTIDEVVKLIMKHLPKAMSLIPYQHHSLNKSSMKWGHTLLTLSTSPLHLDAFLLQ